MQQRIYIDTSVVGGYFDEEFSEWSIKLFEEFESGKKLAMISDVVNFELQDAPQRVRNLIYQLIPEHVQIVFRNDESFLLAEKYVQAKIVSRNYFEDAHHIALATIYNADVLVSWNFKHIVNLQRINKFNAVNLMNGYRQIEIRTPRETLDL